MSAKYSKNNQKKNNRRSRKGVRAALWAAIVVLSLVLLASLVLLWGFIHYDELVEPTVDTTAGTETTAPAATDTVPEQTVKIEQVGDASINLGYGLSITDVGKYTGVYMEDGTDEIVTGVLMIVVTNSGDEDIEYAEIALATEAGEASFSLSTLPAGQSVVLLEKNRLPWSAEEGYQNAVMRNTTVFKEPLSLCQDQLRIQPLDGALNITNISGEDITGDIVIYYKNSSSDMLYGGITYRVRLTGGLKADEIRQIISEHYSPNGSTVMFATVG